MDVVKARHGARTWQGSHFQPESLRGDMELFFVFCFFFIFYFFTWHLRGYFKAAFSELFVRQVGKYIRTYIPIYTYNTYNPTQFFSPISSVRALVLYVCTIHMWPSSLKGDRNEYSR